MALTKRFALPMHLAAELGIERHRRFPDTATVAALALARNRRIIERYRRGLERSVASLAAGRTRIRTKEPSLLHSGTGSAAAREEQGWPPAYLAVLTMDGDQMGQWLRGDKNPTLHQAIHPRMAEYFARIGASDQLNAKRPVGPALHAAISEALTNFAMRITPGIVNRHKGELIYAGGDDVLALVPTEMAIACAEEIQRAFRGIRWAIARQDIVSRTAIIGW